MVEACHSLHRGLQGEVDLAKLFAYDAVYEDMALRALFVGRSAIERYVRRINRLAPFAAGSTVRHIVGSTLGGGTSGRHRLSMARAPRNSSRIE